MIEVDLEEPGEVVPIHEDHIVVSSVSVHPCFRFFEILNDIMTKYIFSVLRI